MHTLLMLLAAPMQSWGHRSRFDDRDTGLEPTRSGVIGLVCAALGIPRDGDPSRFDAIRMGVRIDAPGRPQVDYHTAADVVRADMSGRENTVQSWRHYLADARFIVGLESADLDLLRDIDAALRNPQWPLFLGRKSFVPSLPVHLPNSSVRENTDLEQALETVPWHRLHPRERRPEYLRLVLERHAAGEDQAPIVRNDWPVSFVSARRRFSLRNLMIRDIPAEDVPEGEVLPCSFHASS
jgi:CRISPR system Cascade subunit CasD